MPTMTYNECNSDSDKEIWITMFDEETTMDLFPSPPETPQITSNLQTLLRSAISSEDQLTQDVKNESPCEEYTWKLQSKLYSDDKSLTEKAIHDVGFNKHFTWQYMQHDDSQPIEQTVKRRLIL